MIRPTRYIKIPSSDGVNSLIVFQLDDGSFAVDIEAVPWSSSVGNTADGIGFEEKEMRFLSDALNEVFQGEEK